MIRFSIRDLFWLALVVGLGTCLWLSRSRETKVHKENVRLDWETRILEAEFKSQGGSVKDDGKSITLITDKGTVRMMPNGDRFWKGDDGSNGSATNVRTLDGKPYPPYAWPPRRQSEN